VPALPAVPNVARIDVFYTLSNDAYALTRLHVKYTGSAPNSAACAAIASALYTDFAAEFGSYMTARNSLTGLQFTDLATTSGASGAHYATTTGTLSSEGMAASICMLTKLNIARRYRGGKPRAYLPLGDLSVLQDGQNWLPSFVNNVNAALAALVGDIAVTNSGGCSLQNLVNVSYYSGFTVVTNPVSGRARNVPKLRVAPVVDDVTSWTAEQRFASQRRRLLRSS
jgi:hypothetical protein